MMEQVFDNVHEPSSYLLASVVFGNGEPTYLDSGVTTKLLALGKVRANLFPAAADDFILAHLVVENTEIGGNTSIVLQNERIGYTKFERRLRILEQEIVELLVSAIEVSQLIVGCQADKVHGSDANCDVLLCLGHLRLKLAAVLGPLLLAHVLYLQPSHLEVEGILAFQHGGFSDRSCHNKDVFKLNIRVQRYNFFFKYDVTAPTFFIY